MIFPDYLFYRFAALLYMGARPFPVRAALLISILYCAVLSAAGISLLCYVNGGAWARGHVHALFAFSALLFAVLSYYSYERYKDAFPILATRWAHDRRGMVFLKSLLAIGVYLFVLLASVDIIVSLPF